MHMASTNTAKHKYFSYRFHVIGSVWKVHVKNRHIRNYAHFKWALNLNIVIVV